MENGTENGLVENLIYAPKICHKIAYFYLFVTKLYDSHLESTLVMLA